MSVTIDFAFDASKPLPGLAADVNGVLGCNLTPYEGSSGDFYCRLLGLEFSLAEHSLENDRDCDFRTYKYVLDTRTPVPDAHLRQLQLEATALAAFTLMVGGIASEGILTYDVQRLLARYVMRGKHRIFDEVSQLVVAFPLHLAQLRERSGE